MMSRLPALQRLLAVLQLAWAQRQPREKNLLRLSAALLLLASVWGLALAPALRTWQEAPAQQARLDQQTQRMRLLQAQAQSMQKNPSISRPAAIQWLQSHLADLGQNAQISLQGEHALLSLEAAPAQALANWLTSARELALAVPVQAQLQQGAAQANSGPAKAPSGNAMLWRGTLLLRLP